MYELTQQGMDFLIREIIEAVEASDLYVVRKELISSLLISNGIVEIVK